MNKLINKYSTTHSLTCNLIRWSICALSLSVLTTIPARAESINGNQVYSTKAQPLYSALTEFAGQSGIQFVYDAALVKGLSSPALHGEQNKSQALTRLLQNSGLSFRFTGPGTVVLYRSDKSVTNDAVSPYLLPVADASDSSSVGDSQSQTMPKVTVEADSDNPYKDPNWATDPYNADYVLPNATAGTKTNTPIMETPLNVQVISKQVLKDQQVIRLSDALKNVSGVSANNVPGSFSQGTAQPISIRGFESQTFFRNGFRLQQGAASRAMANVESVEVLKGSAAILYGLVEPGGMVNVVTKQPLAAPYYGFTQQIGSYDLYRTTLDATGPITKNKDLLYRVNMTYENSGSFRDFVNKEDVFIAPVFKRVISPKTQATFEMEYNYQHLGQDQGFIALRDGKFLNIPRNRNYGEYSPATTETIFGGYNWSHQFSDDWSVKHSLSINRQRINSSNVRPEGVDFDNNLVNRVKYALDLNYDTYSTNLDLVGHFDTLGLRHTLLMGGDYYRLDTSDIEAQNATSDISLSNPIHPGTPFTKPNLFIQNPTKTDQYGLYIQDQIKLPYSFQVLGGIRYQYLHQISIFNAQSTDGDSSELSGKSDDAVTPRVGVLWQPINWLSLYANYVESFGAQAAGLRLASGELVPPTGAEQFEGGIKGDFFGGRLRATIAYYDLTKTNIATPDLSNPGFSILTGAARSRGPEIDITGEILPGWNIIATYANMDARVTKSTDNSGFSPAVGDRLFNTSRNMGSIWSTYEFQDTILKGLKFGGGVTLRDGQTGCCNIQLPAIEIPGYATVDLLAGYGLDVGKTKITAQLNINNLLNKHYFSSTQNFRAFNSGFVDYGQPRTFMGSINIQY